MLKISFFAIIYFIILLVYEIMNGRKKKVYHNVIYWIIKIIFYIYVLLLIKVTIFPIPIQKLELDSLRQNFGNGLDINFIPMKTILQIIKSDLPVSVKLRQIGGNLILLVPFAFYLPLSKKRFQKAIKVFIFLLFSACMIELVQFLIGKIIDYNYRVVDVDDIILNVCGGMIGFFAWKTINKCFLETRVADENI